MAGATSELRWGNWCQYCLHPAFNPESILWKRGENSPRRSRSALRVVRLCA